MLMLEAVDLFIKNSPRTAVSFFVVLQGSEAPFDGLRELYMSYSSVGESSFQMFRAVNLQGTLCPRKSIKQKFLTSMQLFNHHPRDQRKCERKDLSFDRGA